MRCVRTGVGPDPGVGAPAGAPATLRRAVGQGEAVVRAGPDEEEGRPGAAHPGAAVEPGLLEVGHRDIDVGLAQDEHAAVPCSVAGFAASAARGDDSTGATALEAQGPASLPSLTHDPILLAAKEEALAQSLKVQVLRRPAEGADEVGLAIVRHHVPKRLHRQCWRGSQRGMHAVVAVGTPRGLSLTKQASPDDFVHLHLKATPAGLVFDVMALVLVSAAGHVGHGRGRAPLSTLERRTSLGEEDRSARALPPIPGQAANTFRTVGVK